MKKKKFGLGLLALVTVAMVLFSQFAFAAGEASPTGDNAPVQSSEQVNDPPETTEEPPANPPEETPGEETGDPPSTEDPPAGTGEGEEPEDQGGPQPDEDAGQPDNALPEDDLLRAAGCTVKFVYGSETLAVASVDPGDTIPPATFTTAKSKLDGMLKTGQQTFQYWYTGTNTKVDAAYKVQKSITVSPSIKTTTEYKYTITFHKADGGIYKSEEVSSTDVYPKAPPTPAAPTSDPGNATFYWINSPARDSYTSLPWTYTSDRQVYMSENWYPVWLRKVTFDPGKFDGDSVTGSGSVSPTQVFVQAGKEYKLPTPTCTVTQKADATVGYRFESSIEFKGWYDNNTTVGMADSLYRPTSKEKTLVAKWGTLPGQTYTVTFVTEGQSGASGDEIVVDGVAKGATIANFPKISLPGKVINGWTDGTNTWKVQADGKVTGGGVPIGKDLRLTPVTKTASLEVRFNVDGATKSELQQNPNYGDTVDKPEVEPLEVEVDGVMVQYPVIGWAVDNKDGAFWDFSKPVYTNMTLYAVRGTGDGEGGGGGGGGEGGGVNPDDRKEICSVTFHPANGAETYIRNVVKGTAVSEPDPKPVKGGHTFLYWSRGTTASDGEYNFSTPVESNIKLTAIWIKDADVVFNSDGGNFISVVTTPRGKTVARPVDPVKAGYTFQGWSTKRQGDSPADALEKFDFSTEITSGLIAENNGGADGGKLTIWAWYDCNTKVVFHYRNGSGSDFSVDEFIETVPIREGDSRTIPYRVPQDPDDPAEPSVIPEGKAFSHWEYANGKEATTGDRVKVGETVEVYAVWHAGFKILYKVDSNQASGGGTDYIMRQMNYAYTAETITPPPFNEEIGGKYIYVPENEWYWVETLDGNPVNFATLANDLKNAGKTQATIYGKWKENDNRIEKTVTYRPMGGTLTVTHTGDIKNDDGSITETVSMGEKPKAEMNYSGPSNTIFGGWSLDPQGTRPVSVESMEIVEDLKVYARWMYTVTFIPTPETKPEDYDLSTVAQNGYLSPPETPFREDYTFVGWRMDGAEKNWDFWNDQVTGNITLRGVWKVMVTFDPRNGQPLWSVDPNEGGTVERPEDPFLSEDHAFRGWFENVVDERTRFYFSDDENPTQVTKSIRLQAKYERWNDIGAYKLVLTAGPGGRVNSSVSGYHDGGDNLTLQATPYDGYTFDSWVVLEGGGIIVSPKSATTVYAMPAMNSRIEARFKPVSTRSSGGGGGSSGGGSSSTGSRMLKDPATLRAPAAQQNTAAQQTAPAAVFNINGSGRINADRMDDLIASNATKDVVLQSPDFTFRFAKGTMRQVPGKETYSFNASFEVQDQAAIEALAGDALVLTVHYDYDGQLPAEAEITINVGKQYAGRTLYYYYYNPETGALELTQSATVSSDGTVTIRQNHCSDYAFLTVNLYDGADETGSASGAAGGNTGSGGSKQQSAAGQTAAPANATGSGTSNRRLPNAGEGVPWALTLVGGAAMASSLVFLRKFKKALYTEDGKEE